MAGRQILKKRLSESWRTQSNQLGSDMSADAEIKDIATALHYCCLTKDVKHAERVVREIGAEAAKKLVRIVNEEN